MELKKTERIRNQVLERLDVTRELTDEEILNEIRSVICELGQQEALSLDERLNLQKDIYNSLRRLDVLQDLLDSEDVTEIMINGPDNIFVERKGVIEKSEKRFFSEEKLYDVIQQIVGANNQIVNESNPIVDTRLGDGSRVNIVLPPIAVDGCILSIRRFPSEPINMKRLLELNSISDEMVLFLKKVIAAGYNIFVSGGTGSGKTTFLNALTEFIPKGQRVITIEDSAELQVIGVDNLVRLEARDANMEGKLEVTIRDLVRSSLRMRPDRIIVGECRGAEALEVLQANNTGHDGSLSTGHANSTRDMIARLETMVLMAGMELPVSAIRQQIASGIDLFVHLGRLQDGSRKVLEIAEVTGFENGEVMLQTLYEYVGKEGMLWEKRNELQHTRKLVMAGMN